jgi:hypothetical protein
MTPVHILDENGKKHKAYAVKGRWPKVVEALKQEAGPLDVCFEASNGYGWLHDNLVPVKRTPSARQFYSRNRPQATGYLRPRATTAFCSCPAW